MAKSLAAPGTRTVEKARELRERLVELAPVVVAFSGGVDSSLLLAEAVDALGDAATAAIAVSPSLAAEDLDVARRLCSRLGVRVVEVPTRELDDPDYVLNAGDRCFFCKTEHYHAILAATSDIPGRVVVDGTQADDLSDDRPGLRANETLGIQSPLRDVGLNKAEIRALARVRGLETWDKPEAACLASRVAVGHPVTAEALEQIDAAEASLRHLGFRIVRVRHHDRSARIETSPEEMARFIRKRDEIVAALRGVGYDTISLDLAGYRRRKADIDGKDEDGA